MHAPIKYVEKGLALAANGAARLEFRQTPREALEVPQPVQPALKSR